MPKCALYRHFGLTGELLYVGISLSPTHRLSQHRCGSPWFHEIANVSIEWFDCREFAETAERRAIKAETPKYNRAHTEVRQASPTPRVEKRGRWCIHQIETGMYDGWYFLSEDAQEMLEFHKSEWPEYSHRLIDGSTPFFKARPAIRLRCQVVA